MFRETICDYLTADAPQEIEYEVIFECTLNLLLWRRGGSSFLRIRVEHFPVR